MSRGTEETEADRSGETTKYTKHTKARDHTRSGGPRNPQRTVNGGTALEAKPSEVGREKAQKNRGANDALEAPKGARKSPDGRTDPLRFSVATCAG